MPMRSRSKRVKTLRRRNSRKSMRGGEGCKGGGEHTHERRGGGGHVYNRKGGDHCYKRNKRRTKRTRKSRKSRK